MNQYLITGLLLFFVVVNVIALSAIKNLQQRVNVLEKKTRYTL